MSGSERALPRINGGLACFWVVALAKSPSSNPLLNRKVADAESCIIRSVH
jgi:hypothetical protein